MDAQNGAGLYVNGKESVAVALGPNINVHLRLSPTRGGKLYNTNKVEKGRINQLTILNDLSLTCIAISHTLSVAAGNLLLLSILLM